MYKDCCSYQVNGETFYGSTPKFKLTIDAEMPMSQFNFDVQLTNDARSITIQKSDMQVDKNGDYYLWFDTKDLGVGSVKAIITAYIPDEALPNNTRKEITVINKLVLIKNV